MRKNKRAQMLELYGETLDKVAAWLAREKIFDKAEERLKQAAAILMDAGLGDLIDFPAFPRVRDMTVGFDVPGRANQLLVQLDRWGVPRELLLAAAIQAKVISPGRSARANLTNRLATTRKQIANSLAAFTEKERTKTSAPAAYLKQWADAIAKGGGPTEPDDVIAAREMARRAEIDAIDAKIDALLGLPQGVRRPAGR